MPKIILIKNHYPDHHALKNVIRYVLRAGVIGGYAVDPDDAFHQMMLVKRVYYKTKGLPLVHFVVSFDGDEVGTLSQYDPFLLGQDICSLFGHFQMVYGQHCNTGHIHFHFVLNTVDYRTGHKFCRDKEAFQRLKTFLRERFPGRNCEIYTSYPNTINQFEHGGDNEVLEIGW